ncbi:hypothetical protein [Paucibacter sp. M5-1]|uniref:hypothetical protein n=1 Tax=Paucibacter sp. M5-1 TaxID=3015998 RepID=UPI0022B8BDE4|nr:hypothetical protein [Paucibacter sp. M5-1]MCZ7881943.1 hypothetical protein [Paucibacter sp. M5-1]
MKAEAPDANEFAGLRRSGLARLADARTDSLSLEGRFDLAYNAAHALCLAALRWHGWRSSNRYIVFQLLPHTLGLGPEVWRVLDKCHQVRNLGEYEGDLNVDDRLVNDLIAAAAAVAAKLDALGPPST